MCFSLYHTGIIQLINRCSDRKESSCQEINSERSTEKSLVTLVGLEWHGLWKKHDHMSEQVKSANNTTHVARGVLYVESTTLDTSRAKCSRSTSTESRASEDRHSDDGGSGERWGDRSERKARSLWQPNRYWPTPSREIYMSHLTNHRF